VLSGAAEGIEPVDSGFEHWVQALSALTAGKPTHTPSPSRNASLRVRISICFLLDQKNATQFKLYSALIRQKRLGLFYLKEG
jgi:hypothetical protein